MWHSDVQEHVGTISSVYLDMFWKREQLPFGRWWHRYSPLLPPPPASFSPYYLSISCPDVLLQFIDRGGGGGGGGLFLDCEDLGGGEGLTIHFPPALFFLLLFFSRQQFCGNKRNNTLGCLYYALSREKCWHLTDCLSLVVGFFPLHYEGFGGRLDESVSACAFFFKGRSAREPQFHCLGQIQSTAAERVEMTVAERSLRSCVWARFPDSFSYYAWTA